MTCIAQATDLQRATSNGIQQAGFKLWSHFPVLAALNLIKVVLGPMTENSEPLAYHPLWWADCADLMILHLPVAAQFSTVMLN